jgi:hypothetical protein
MRFRKYSNRFVYGLFCLLATGCAKQTSYYYADKETPGTAIFSNTSNNLFSCLVGDSSWRTITRSVGGGLFTRPVYEVFIEKHTTSGTTDTLSITWLGDPAAFRGNYSSISLGLPVAKSFKITDLAALQNKRIIIDNSNGFFQVNMTGLQGGNKNGKGSIYFNRLSFEVVGTNTYTGYMAGLLEADFGSFKILSGRFDHFMNPDQLIIY